MLEKRSTPATKPNQTRALFANLRRRPATSIEAMEIARHFRCDSKTQSGVERIMIGDQIVGTTLHADLRHGGCACVADLELATTAIALESHELRLPTLNQPSTLAMARLGELGKRGLVDRGHQRFKTRINPIEVPLIYSLFQVSQLTLLCGIIMQIVNVDSFSPPTVKAKFALVWEDKANAVWNTASRLHFNRDFRLNSQSLAASVTERRSIGGRAWPNFSPHDPAHESTLVLWSNTTLGLFLFWWHASRQQVGRAILTISQLSSLLVIDTTKLS